MNPEHTPGRHRRGRAFALKLLLLLAAIAAPGTSSSNEPVLHRAQAMRDAGDLQGALLALGSLAAARPGDHSTMLEIVLLRVDLLRRLGRLDQAGHALSQLRAHLGDRPVDAQLRARMLRQSALLQFQAGEGAQARETIDTAREHEEQLPPALRASLLSDAAIIQPDDAPDRRIASFEEAARLAAGSPAEIGYRINAARAQLEDGRVNNFLGTAQITRQLIEETPLQTSVPYRLALAALYRQAVNDFDADPGHRLQALMLLQPETENAALPARLQALVDGYRAELYADDRQFDIALRYARHAIDAADRAGSTDLSWRWEWVLARAFDQLDQPEAAIAAYARATAGLARVRSQLERFDPETLDEVIKPLYYEYAGLMLRNSTQPDGDENRQRLLGQARAALEALKLAEVENYFNEQCLGDQEVLLEQVAEDTAVLYPVLLEDRLELLLTTPGGIRQVTVPVARDALVALIRDFRLNIQVNTGTDAYLRQAKQLYEFLVQPLEGILGSEQTQTLVFVPDGPLRTIPLAALHDGKRFLVERFALATTPGLTLIEPRPLAGGSYPALAGGVSEPVQGFAGLPGVERELNLLAELLDATVLHNRAFSRERLATALRQGEYSVVHLATHGQFRGSYDNSFLLTHDGRLLIDELGASIQSRAGGGQSPLELLVLSACETAAGDDRAALGLAGVAIKAGARSALATLWEVDDRATQEVIQAFYRSLTAGHDSRARSLQQAQLTLIRSPDHSHPSLWAPFLLIGNWL
ncbi:MAG: hypothetical protein CME40_10980 [Haliea sp.]|nr:hypothetical protein [Haliea sp.]